MKQEVKTSFLKRHGLVAVLAVLIVVAIGLTVGIIVINIGNQVGDNTEIVTPDDESTTAELNEYIESVNQSIAQAQTNEEKAVLYATRSASLSNSISQYKEGDFPFYDQILSDLYTAEELAPTAGTAYNIYAFENEHGDKSKAEYYYNLAIERGYVEEEGNG